MIKNLIFKIKKKLYQLHFKYYFKINDKHIIKLVDDITNEFSFLTCKKEISIITPIEYRIFKFYFTESQELLDITIRRTVSVHWTEDLYFIYCHPINNILDNYKKLLYKDIYPKSPYEALRDYIFLLIIREYI